MVVFFKKNKPNKFVGKSSQIRLSAKAEKRTKWILSYLKKNKTIKSLDIIKKFKVVKDTAARDLKYLINIEKITKQGAGSNVWYELKNTGFKSVLKENIVIKKRK